MQAVFTAMLKIRGRVWLAFCAALLFSMVSCAPSPAPVHVASPPPPPRTVVEQQPETREQKAPPPPREEARRSELSETLLSQAHEPASGIKPEKPLPKMLVSLRMHNADLPVVLRAMARSVNQNIVMNDRVKGTISVDIERIPWDQAFSGVLKSNGLDYEWEGDLIRIISIEDRKLNEEMRARKLAGAAVEPLMLKIIPLKYADPWRLQMLLTGTARQVSASTTGATGMAGAAGAGQVGVSATVGGQQSFLSKDEKGQPRGSITVDEHTNSLLINAIPKDVEKISEIVKKLDKPTRQIIIESKIVEATKDTAMNLGVQWGGFYKAGNFGVTPGGTNGTINPTTGQVTYTPFTGTTGISGQGFGVNFPSSLAISPSGTLGTGAAALGVLVGKIGGNVLDAQLSALEAKSLLKIISTPSIMTLDNQPAFTQDGESVPYVSTTSLGATQVSWVDAVLRLEIRPHVISEDTLKLDVIVNNDEVDFAHAVEGNPLIVRKQTRTTLICKNGETIVISGLTKNTNSKLDQGVPGLMHMPLLGPLFRSKSDTSELEQVLVFITPHLLPPYATKTSMSEE